MFELAEWVRRKRAARLYPIVRHWLLCTLDVQRIERERLLRALLARAEQRKPQGVYFWCPATHEACRGDAPRPCIGAVCGLLDYRAIGTRDLLLYWRKTLLLALCHRYNRLAFVDCQRCGDVVPAADWPRHLRAHLAGQRRVLPVALAYERNQLNRMRLGHPRTWAEATAWATDPSRVPRECCWFCNRATGALRPAVAACRYSQRYLCTLCLAELEAAFSPAEQALPPPPAAPQSGRPL